MLATALLSAFWLGILTAISPCPLATNIAAISFIGQKTGRKKMVLVSGFLYATGRILAYLALGMIITTGLLGKANVARFLQKYMNEALGPLLIFLGLILLGWIGEGLSFQVDSTRLQEKAQTGGVLWSLPLGAVFALSFCPVSAGLFFGGLLPLALQQNSKFLFPVAYGIGTALPVILFAFLMAWSSEYVGKAFKQLSKTEIWVRRLAGTIFILAGIYYCLTHIYGLSL